MLTRRIARPLLASWFVAEGLNSFRRPADHVERIRDAWRQLAGRVDVPEPPDEDRMRLITRLHGAATATAGLMLALGKAPRTAACALTVLTLPLAAMDAPRRGQQSPSGGPTDGQRAFVRDLSLIGGAALAALDREGNPGIGWRMQHAREKADGQ
jgi:uncharacterized membrane protein YphA (DoxX/SURF4 family)